jgi:ABC-type uncharacterized transport system permease subunit
MAMESGFLAAAGIGYLVASASYGAHVLVREPRLAIGARIAAVVGVICHTVAIGVHCATTHHTPFTTPAETLSASAWAIVLAYLALDLFLRQPALGAVVQPIAFLCLFTGAVLHRARVLTGGSAHPAAINPQRDIDGGMINLHVIAILFAFGLLVLAFGCAVLYLAQHSMLKKKRSGSLFGKLPPLATIDQLAFGLVAFAFPLLTVGIIAGVIRASGGAFPHGWAVDPKILLSAVTWIVYGVYLGLHVLAHWRGPRANYLLIGGLLIALATYFAPTGVHKFG